MSCRKEPTQLRATQTSYIRCESTCSRLYDFILSQTPEVCTLDFSTLVDVNEMQIKLPPDKQETNSWRSRGWAASEDELMLTSV